jgi:hypothetical protein
MFCIILVDLFLLSIQLRSKVTRIKMQKYKDDIRNHYWYKVSHEAVFRVEK